MPHSEKYLLETALIAGMDSKPIEEMAKALSDLRSRRGRLFVIGLGGSAANASHAVNDFRKLCGIESYCPSDNVAELTARANDDGWDYIYSSWLLYANEKDGLFILSVGGGTETVSRPLINAIDFAKINGMKIFGIVGRDGGYTKLHADHCIIIPTVEPSRVTPHTEAFQSVILHCLVSHPDLQKAPTKW